MSSFPQYTLESFLCLLIFYGYYQFAVRAAASFSFRIWYLRLAPLAACLLPLLPIVFAEKEADILALDTLKMTSRYRWQKELPEFTISWGLLVRMVYFAGFTLAALRLTDKCWAIGMFLRHQGNQPVFFPTWQASATARFGQLFFLWEKWEDRQKEEWAAKWLPIHPIFAWEALLIHFLLLINWWNPAMHGFIKNWQELYDREFLPQKNERTHLRLAGAFTLVVSLALFFSLCPARFSPTASMGKTVSAWSGQVIFEYKKAKEYTYTLRWGQFSIPLKKLANPNGFGGEIEMELTDFQQVLHHEIEVFQGEKLVETGILSFLYYSKAAGDRAYINAIDPKKVVLKDRRQGKTYNDSVRFGDELVLFGEAGDIYLTKVQFRIRDPFADYEPVVKVPEINHLEASSSFQVVGRAGKRALVKIDSSSPGSWYIREMYNDPTQYEIVEIPGFRTNRRYLSESEALSTLVAAYETELTKGLPDVYYLPEYQDYQNREIRLEWGMMTADPSSQNYPGWMFSHATEQELMLSVGGQSLEVVAFEMIVAGKNIPSVGFLTNRLDHPAIRQAVQNLKPETSIYFDRLVVKDADGSLKLFPAAFVFNIGKASFAQ